MCFCFVALHRLYAQKWQMPKNAVGGLYIYCEYIIFFDTCVIKEWLRNNSKFSLWEWLYNSISPNKHQRIYRYSTSPTGSENHLSSLRFQTFNRKVFWNRNEAKEWLKNNFKFSLLEWLYNSIPPNNHQRQYRWQKYWNYIFVIPKSVS